LRTNAHRPLRISLAAAAVLLLFVQCSFGAQTYTVRKGNTLHQIAQKFGVTVAALQKANHLSSPNRIRTGQTLLIPSNTSKTPAPPSEPITYGRAAQDVLEVESDGKVLTTLGKDTHFVVLSREGDKLNVKLADGRTGWVSAGDVVLEETRKPLPVSDRWSVKSDIVRTAYAYRGTRYRFGGTSGRGFDCSGFVKFVYATKGIKLPHSSRELFNHGTPVSKVDVQPGDLVFFKNTYRYGISHVGLYVGDGRFIHASTHRGGVRVDNLSDAYFSRRYAGAKRI